MAQAGPGHGRAEAVLGQFLEISHFINTEQNIMAKLNGKLNLTELDVDVIQNTSRGNCFYKSISQFYLDTEEYHIFYRKQIAEYIDLKKDTYSINILISAKKTKIF